ncbi:helix-turn-helix domain-containing protein [Halomonas alkaliantarctica]|nr:helix-turn-helix domain-containing protein [Halomonas alkaliantarctica]
MAQDRVEAVERALTVLEVFDSPKEYFSLAELAEHTGFYKSTLLRLLGSLARFDYVYRDAAGMWRLGDSPRRLARHRSPSRQLATRVAPVLERLASALGETAALLVETPEGIECQLAELPHQALRHDLRPGMSWQAQAADDPRPELSGGEMVAVVLPDTQPRHWLSLSGPAGRLQRKASLNALQEAVNEIVS